MSNKIIICLLLVFAANNLFSQVFINEINQGPGGNPPGEYVEFIVVGDRTCTDSCYNIQNWILDDNNGFFGTNGIAGGHLRFNSDPQWQCVPFGTMIVIYNPLNPYAGITIDETDANNDNVYFLPSNSSYFDGNLTVPMNGTPAVTYAGAVYTGSGAVWDVLGMQNGNDVFQTVNPTNLTTDFHSVGWGSSAGMDIAFVGGASGLLFQNENITNDDPYTQTNWASQLETAATPGIGNSVNNTAWINNMLTPSTISVYDTIYQSICVGDSFLFNSNYYFNSGIHTDTFSMACDSVVSLNLSIQVCFCDINLGPDTLICGPINQVLDAGIFDTYLWQDNSTNQTFTAVSSGQYYCEGRNLDTTNLVVNPGFESGAVNFTTDYTPGVGGTWGLLSNPGTYAVSTSPSLVHNNFQTCVDHTSGTGNMMIVNGSNTANQAVWCQTIAVTANTDYFFSIWALSAENTNAANVASLHFELDGVQIGTNFSPAFASCVWNEFTETWNSGTNTSVNLCIYNHTISGNNDFAIDDIFFGEVCITSDTINILNQTNLIDSLSIEICSIDSALIFGNYETQEGLYQDTLISASGCDSVYIKRYLNVRDSLFSNVDTSICFGETIFLDNALQSTSGYYIDTFLGSSMCDSFVYTNLTVAIAPILDTLVDCTDIPANAGINIIDTVFNSHGCDSIYNFSNLTYATLDSSYSLSCTDDITMAGTTRDTALNALGCDSFYTIAEIDYYMPNSNVIIDSCTNIMGNAMNQIDTILNALGCDSVYNISIVNFINPDTILLTDSCTNIAAQSTVLINDIVSVDGCDSMTTIQNVVYIMPVQDTLSPVEICEGESATIFGTTYSQNGTFTEDVLSVNGCDSISRVQSLIVNPKPIVHAGNDTTIKEGVSINIMANGANTYVWDHGETADNFNIVLAETTSFSVLGIDSNYCQGKDSLTVFVIEDEIIMLLPNAFTPNGDGINDEFGIANPGQFDDIVFRVYNRWGEMIFMNDKNIDSWNGKYKNVDQPISSYVYYIEAIARKNSQKFNVSGAVSLIR